MFAKDNIYLIDDAAQEAAKESKAALISPEDLEDVESPLPSNIVQPVRRRGAISAEPINEEDAASYVKKVLLTLDLLCLNKCWLIKLIKKIVAILGCS